jgi:hypothetical protein
MFGLVRTNCSSPKSGGLPAPGADPATLKADDIEILLIIRRG